MVVSTFIIWSKFTVFQPHCRKNFSIAKELKVVATFIRNINENQMVFPGGIEPLGSFQLIYATGLEVLCWGREHRIESGGDGGCCSRVLEKP